MSDEFINLSLKPAYKNPLSSADISTPVSRGCNAQPKKRQREFRRCEFLYLDCSVSLLLSIRDHVGRLALKLN